MKAEYKRDINGNYLVLYENEEPDTSSYQMRMLVGNTIPSILKCRVQGVDGQFMVCFDITSKQSVVSLYEEKKIRYSDLQMILSGFVQVMEEMSEYLLNPGRLVIKPEYMYVDLEKRQLFFCYLPGYDEDVRQKFQELTEYILPKLDHEDSKVVMLGYGVYRQALEDSFHLEHIKKELYLERETTDNIEFWAQDAFRDAEISVNKEKYNNEKDKGKNNKEKNNKERNSRENAKERNNGNKKTADSEKEFMSDKSPEKLQEHELWMDEKYKKQDDYHKEKRLGSEKGVWLACFMAALSAVAIVTASTLGYLPKVSTVSMLSVVLVLMAIGMAGAGMYSFLKKRNGKCQKNTKARDHKIMEKKEKAENSEGLYSEEKRTDPAYSISEEYNSDTESSPDFKVKKANKTSHENKMSILQKNFGETVVLSDQNISGPATLVSKEPGELATIYLQEELTVIGKMQNAVDAVIDLPTVSRVHAKIRKRDEEYYLTDLNSRNGTSVNGRMLKCDEEYCLQDQDEVDFAQARYIFLK